MKSSVSEYAGSRFGSLVVIGEDKSNPHFNSIRWLLKCDCGNTVSVLPSRILSGHKKSCGCLKGQTSRTHGCNGDEFYPTWWAMMRRCYNHDSHNYDRYGGRGITVCEQWHNPQCFIDWARTTAGHKASNLTLERIDNNQGYSPDNCRWASFKEQANNRRNNHLETINGETKTITEWCKHYGISTQTVRARQKRGLSLQDALTQEVKSTKFSKS